MKPGKIHIVSIVGIAALFFLPFLGEVHLFDWDEINFAEVSREMIVMKNYLQVHIDFVPFWEKPPLFFWLQATAMNLFGIGEYAARLPNAICGIITLPVIYAIGSRLYNNKLGLIWAGVYFGSLLPFLYFKSGIIDPWFNLFIFSGLYYFLLFYWKKENYEHISIKRNKYFYLIVSGLFIGLAIITKGPTALLIIGLCFMVYWVKGRFKLFISIPDFLLFLFASLVFMLTWYGIETFKNGTFFIIEFTRYQYRLFSTPDAGHGGFFGYHFVVLLIGCFPASIFAIRGLFRQSHQYEFQRNFKTWMLILFWVVLILFSIVQSKIVHYSSLAYFPLTFFAALTIYQIIENKIKFSKGMKVGLGIIGGIFCLATISLPFLGMHIGKLKPLFEQDPFAVANLDAKVNWTGFEAISGFFLLTVLIISFLLFNRKKVEAGFKVLFLGIPVFIMLVLGFYIGKIESYSQRAAIEFFKTLQGKDVYVTTIGYKSYAHLFYSEKQQPSNPNHSTLDWLYQGAIDKDTYFASKINKNEQFLNNPNFTEIYRKNGFVFYVRKKKNG